MLGTIKTMWTMKTTTHPFSCMKLSARAKNELIEILAKKNILLDEVEAEEFGTYLLTIASESLKIS